MVLVSCVRLFSGWCYGIVFFKQKTAYEMRISDWSSDVCSSDLLGAGALLGSLVEAEPGQDTRGAGRGGVGADGGQTLVQLGDAVRVDGVLGLGQEGAQLAVGGQHGVDQAGLARGGFLRDLADPGGARIGDAAAVGVQLAGNQLQEGGLDRKSTRP